MKNTHTFENQLPIRSFLIGLVLFSFLCSCGASTEKKPTVAAVTETPDSNPRIVFVNYKAEKNERGIIAVSVINKIIKEGKLKGDNSSENMTDTGFNILQLDTNEKPISITTLENPLSRVVEAVGDDGELSMQRIELNETEFSVRLQLDSKTEYIAIKMKDTVSKKMLSLLTTKINEP